MRFRRYVTKFGNGLLPDDNRLLSPEEMETMPYFIRWIDTDWITKAKN